MIKGAAPLWNYGKVVCLSLKFLRMLKRMKLIYVAINCSKSFYITFLLLPLNYLVVVQTSSCIN